MGRRRKRRPDTEEVGELVGRLEREDVRFYFVVVVARREYT